MLIARTSRSTGVGVGPLGLFVLVIGGLLYAALLLICITAVAVFIAAKWGSEWARGRRRQISAAAPVHTRAVGPPIRGHREITALERAIMAQPRH